MSRLKTEIILFLSALMFLTRIPVPAWVGHSDDRMARAARYFPAVGLVVGTLVGLVWYVASLQLPPLPAAGVALAFSLLLTGVFHEDGLSDCCDGLGGGLTRERAMEIMRDSRIGAYGSAALIVALGLRWVSIASLSPLDGLLALIVSSALGRMMVVMALRLATYARPEGSAATMASGVRVWEVAFAGVIGGGAAMLLAGPAGLLAMLIASGVAALMLAQLLRRLGGYTGDGLGAIEQLSEITALLVLVGAWSTLS